MRELGALPNEIYEACRDCGAKLEPLTTPITTSGWYQGRLYIWENGQPKLLDVCCASCRAKEERP